MSVVATLEVELRGRDVNVDAMLARIDARLLATNAGAQRTASTFGGALPSGMQRSTSSALSLQQAQARLEVQQGNLAGAAQRLQNALAQTSTTTVQTVNAQRQLLAVQTQLATGTSALGGHFQSLQGSLGAVGGAIGGLPGQLLSVSTGIGAVTAAIGIGVGVVKSFGDAFVFKAGLDATTASITAQLKGVRESSQVYAQAAKFAAQYKLTQQETTEALQASIGVMRNSKASVEDILGVLARLQVLSPEQSLQEAAVAVKALASGDTTSLVTRFEVGRDVANQMKKEIQGGADAVQVMSKFLGETGIGMDVLAAKTTGVAGGFKELAQAQEQLKIAQAEFAAGPGLQILNAQIATTSGATRLLSGDFAAMGQSIQATIAGTSAYNTVLAQGGTITAAAAAQQTAYAAVLAASVPPVAALAQATQIVTDIEQQRVSVLNATAALSQQAQAASLGYADSLAMVGVQARAAALASEMKAGADQVAAVDAQTHAVAQKQLADAAERAANVLLAAGPAGARTAAILAGSSSQVDVLTAAYYRLAASKAAANVPVKDPLKGVVEDRLTRDTTADRAQVKSNQALEANRKLLSSIAKLESDRTKKASGGGGGGVKLSDQQKLNNSLLADQESFDNKYQDAELDHRKKLLAIDADFSKRMRAAQDALGQSQLDSRAGFYNALGSIEDAGLRQALSAQYEAAFAEADAIAREKGADVGQKFLEAKQSAIEAQGKRASEIAEATKAGDKDKAAYLAGVDKLYQEAEARKLAAITSADGSVAAARDAALADEALAYEEKQGEIADSADRAAERKIAASDRAGKQIDVEKLKVDGLATSYDRLGAAGTRAGVTPAATTPASAPAVPAPPTGTPAAAADPLAVAIEGMRGALTAIEGAVRDAGKGVEGAVRSSARFAS